MISKWPKPKAQKALPGGGADLENQNTSGTGEKIAVPWPKSKRLRVLLADDHAVLRDGLRAFIDAQPDMSVCGQAEEGEEAIRLAADLRPDVVVMDLFMPGLNGIEATRRLRKTWPGAKIVALTVHESPDYLHQLLQAGAAGYLVKRSTADTLVQAIRRVSQGGVFFDADLLHGSINSCVSELGTKPAPSPARLSERETAVLRLLGQGHTAKEAAAHLNISIKTIETYKGRLMKKLDLISRVDLVRYAHERGLILNA